MKGVVSIFKGYVVEFCGLSITNASVDPDLRQVIDLLRREKAVKYKKLRQESATR